jgi:hypothetical protein
LLASDRLKLLKSLVNYGDLRHCTALDFRTKLLILGFALAGAAFAWRTIGQLYLQLQLCAAVVLVYIYLDHRRLPLAPNLRLLLVGSAVFVLANLESFWALSVFSAMGLLVTGGLYDYNHFV